MSDNNDDDNDYNAHHGRTASGHGSGTGSSRPRRRLLPVAVALVVLAGGGTAAWSLLGGDDGKPDARTAAVDGFLDAWARGDADRAGAHTDRPAAASARLTKLAEDLPARKVSLVRGTSTDQGGHRFRATFRLPGGGTWAYDSSAPVVRADGRWVVRWSPAVLHPRLTEGSELALRPDTGNRGELRAADGSPLDGLAPALVGSPGKSGLQYRYDKRLAGRPADSVAIVGTSTGRTLATLHTAEGRRGEPVRTTLDPAVQRAAERALKGLDKNAAVVAVRPSTGEILAAADNPPTGANRSLRGRYAAGSDFKVITAAALIGKGVRGDTPVPCPRYERVNGQRFENQDLFALPAGSTFREGFARSCNTGIIGLRDRLDDDSLSEAAGWFGIGPEWNAGATTYDGSVPRTTGENDKAAAMIGQGRVEASPLVMASVAATVKDGTFRQPVLVPDAAGKRAKATAPLPAGTAAELRSLMRAVVTEGSGEALRGLPGEPGAKTGTAEFGTDSPPRTHAWFIGYQGDLAFSVLIEDGGSGGADAGPVAAEFLEAVAAGG
ncbi:penicillin-binding transpeptidase domain-containing protein [Streptomyces uncialis]|uniref:penicillin-binding transpeptidase domain-containing protein n=1 Tax=Streptomyces uncialis TaxID=1048205 RepID=UPI0022534A47|nr:penicillin-binding transpeptidase domain-containing protein [Streptomyces uncialis]MCX4662011.1 penicillin-binding transpeptidase domain-containing protein [Streptomyces uncialis]